MSAAAEGRVLPLPHSAPGWCEGTETHPKLERAQQEMGQEEESAHHR